MYIPEPFKLTDEKAIYDLVENNSFATLFSIHDGAPCATHLPLVLDKENGMLYGHFARPNRQWEDLCHQEILAVFQGPHGYISSSWYEMQTAVPTWNYVAVHVYGQAELIDDPDKLLDVLNNMMQNYETPSHDYSLSGTNPDFIKKLAKGVVGFKIKIHRMEGKQKLSQNNPEERQKRIIKHLKETKKDDQQQIARLMEKNLHMK